MDNTPEVETFAAALEKAVVSTVENGKMTKDLALLVGKDQEWLTTDAYMDAVEAELQRLMA